MASYTGYTSEQLQKLEELFQECQFPNEELIRKCSNDLEMDPKQIKRWFKNKTLLVEIEEKQRENDVLRTENMRIELENMVMRSELDDLQSCHTCSRNETRERLIRENAILRNEHQRVTNILVGILQNPSSIQDQGRDSRGDVDLELRLSRSMDKSDD